MRTNRVRVERERSHGVGARALGAASVLAVISLDTPLCGPTEGLCLSIARKFRFCRHHPQNM